MIDPESTLLSTSSSSSPPSNNLRSIGLIGVSIFGGIGVSLLAISLPFISPALRRVVLPYVPATDTQLANVVNVLKRAPKSLKPRSLIDLGSGDGRIVIESAKLGIKSLGVELNPWLIIYSKLHSRKLGISKLATFKRKDLWKINTAQFDYVVIFGVQDMMTLLESKITQDCLESGLNTSVIACRFPFPNLKPIETIGTGIDSVWVYKV